MNKEVCDFLETYDVSTKRGFLPPIDPRQQLTVYFDVWEQALIELSGWINAGKVRKKLAQLPTLTVAKLTSKAELERAMLCLSFFGNAFVWGGKDTVNYIPEAIARPWVEVAEKLGRSPIMSHASLVLQNWKKIDPSEPIVVENLATLHQFQGGLDESWFYLITVEIEQIAAEAVYLTTLAMLSAKMEAKNEVLQSLEQLAPIIKAMTTTLSRMRENCDPYIFYTRVRPFLASFNKIDYRGTAGNTIKSFHGGSAAQSSIFQFLDAALNISHLTGESNHFLEAMLSYMPPTHAQFIREVRQSSSLRDYCGKESNLKEAYNNCIEQIYRFRKEHLKIVGLYIMSQAKRVVGSGAVGTGGTNPLDFLKELDENTQRQLLK